ncbi:Virulence sensor protein BvgS precursor [compost metagenome]
MVASSLGSAILLAGGRFTTDNLLNEWLQWWSGDTLGVLLFAPLSRLLWPGGHPLRVAGGEGYRFALPLIVTATLLVVGHLGLSQLEDLRAKAETRTLMEILGDNTSQNIAETLFPLEGLAHFMAASQEITREEFRKYTHNLINHPSIFSVDWAPLITQAQRAEFEAAVARTGFPDFRITELDSHGQLQTAAQRAEYFPILFSEPLAASRRGLGLDHGFETLRRQAMVVARDNGKAMASDLIRLGRTERHASLMFVPVWRLRDGSPDKDLAGYVVGVVDIQQLLAPLLRKAEERQLALRISDIMPGMPRRVLVDTLTTDVQPDWQRDFHVGGRTWRLEMQPRTPRQPVSTSEDRLFLGFALLSAFLAAFATLSSAGRHALVSREVAERTAQLQRELDARSAAEHALRASEEQRSRFFTMSLDLFCIAGFDGYFRSVNAAFTRTLGWSEEELLSRPIVDFVHPDDVDGTLTEFRLLEQGHHTLGFESRHRCKDGSWRWLTWKALPQPGGLLFATGHDTTEQHRATRQLGELNAQLEQRIEERSQAVADLQAKKEEIRAVLDHLLEGVITMDSRGIVQSANPAIEPLLGYPPEELIGHNVSLLMASPLRERHDGYIAHYLRTGERHIIGSSREVSGRHKDGHAVDLELSVSEYSVHGERFFIGTLRDIREHKALIASLTQAREDAEQASRAKSAFLATMSHEIRTPMNGVVGLIDVLAQDQLPAHQGDLIRTIRESSSNLLGVIDDILDFSKIEAGKLEIDSAPLQLVELIDNLCSTLRPLASARGVILEQEIATDIPHWVSSDAMRLRQILFNLIGNAIKFSGGRSECPGRVAVCARLAAGDPLRVLISVADNGIGIAPEHLGQLFRPFSQAESSTTRRFGGSGLGLAICQRLVDLLGGEISVASTPDSGTVFTLMLPLAIASSPAPSGDNRLTAAQPLSRPDALANRRILVAEDDEVNRKVIQQQLALLGYRFALASHGAEALAMWRQGDYDLILSDLHMPEMDGYQLAASIRQAEAGQQRIPILALTANALRGEATRALEAGMDEYLTKPIRLAALQAALARWLPPEAALVDSAALTALVGEDHEMIREILGDYLDALRSLAPTLHEAFEHNDIDAIDALAHRLKSSSRAVGALRLGELCAALEQAIKNGDSAALARGIAEFAPLHTATAARIEQLLKEGHLA